ncbi:MAG: hypothetical protein ACRCYZ_02200 [Alphaproteobacteria bacterium]
MSRRSASPTFLKFVFIVFLTYFSAFSTSKIELSSEQSRKFRKLDITPDPEFSFFKRLPKDIFQLIFAELSKKDLTNLRTVDKKMRDRVTPFITDVKVPKNLPNQEQVKRFFSNLVTDKFWKGKKPSEVFSNLFRHAPVKNLTLSDENLNDEKIATIAPFFPANLQMLNLNNNDISATGIKSLAPYLPGTLQLIFLGNNNLGDEDVLALMPHLPPTLHEIFLNWSNISDANIEALVLHIFPPFKHFGWPETI